MNRLLLGLAAFGVSFSAFAQGTVYFNNKAVGVDAKIYRADWRDGSTAGAGAGVTAQLAIVGAGGSLTLLFPTTTFKSATPNQARYLNGIVLEIPGTSAGQQINLRMVIWETQYGSFDAARVTGGISAFSNDFRVTLGGPLGDAPDAVPGNLVGLQSFGSVWIPEPGEFGLLGLGGLVLGWHRRDKSSRVGTARG